MFSRKDCPKCQTAKILLQRAGVDFTVVDAEEEAELTRKMLVTEAPTLVLPDGTKYANPSNINGYIASLKA